MIDKLMEFASTGNGRRLLNTLKKREVRLTQAELETVLDTYRTTGIQTETARLKKRGLQSADRYDALADAVRKSCCAERYEEFLVSLKDLLASGIKMNPAKMEEGEEQ